MEQKEEGRKSIGDSNARYFRENEEWNKFISANESEIIHHVELGPPLYPSVCALQVRRSDNISEIKLQTTFSSYDINSNYRIKTDAHLAPLSFLSNHTLNYSYNPLPKTQYTLIRIKI
jgi:hypothetical protein